MASGAGHGTLACPYTIGRNKSKRRMDVTRKVRNFGDIVEKNAGWQG
jgi:hypothetical protein